jgi:hypothetical protein
MSIRTKIAASIMHVGAGQATHAIAAAVWSSSVARHRSSRHFKGREVGTPQTQAEVL